MNILEFTRSTHVRNKIVVGNYQVVQLVVNFGTSTMLYVPVVARVDNLRLPGHFLRYVDMQPFRYYHRNVINLYVCEYPLQPY